MCKSNLYRNSNNPFLVLVTPSNSDNYIVDSQKDEVVPTSPRFNKYIWNEIEFSDLTGDEMNMVLSQSEEEFA